jgi:hypothetical protein
LTSRPPKASRQQAPSSDLLLPPEELPSDLAQLFQISLPSSINAASYSTLSASTEEGTRKSASNKTQKISLQRTKYPHLMKLEIFATEVETATAMRIFLSGHLLFEGAPKETVLLNCRVWQSSLASLNMEVLCKEMKIEWSFA